MHKKRSFFVILILLTLLIIPGTASAGLTSEDNNGNMIFLRTATINTDQLAEEDGQEATISSSSVEEILEDTERYYIVQFKGQVFEEQKEEIMQTGAVMYDYLPDNAFIVKMNASVRSQVSSLDFVKWIGEYQASYKYEPAIAVITNQLMSESEEEKAHLLVMLFDTGDNSAIAEKMAEIGGTVIESSSNILRIEIAKSRVNEIASINGVSWIEEYREPVLSNDVAATIVGVTLVHDTYGLNGSGQIVAVCDTGLDTGVNDDSMHADLRGRIRSIIDVANDGSAADQNGHGTHVSGSVLGNGISLDGQYSGMAPEAELVFQAAGDDSPYLSLPTNLSNIFQPAYDLGARIHTNSWGNSFNGTYTTNAREVDRFMWEHPDMLILFAAGNQGKDVESPYGIVDSDSITPPATAKNCIAVGASENNRSLGYDYVYLGNAGLGGPYSSLILNDDLVADNVEGITAFSSRGPTDDGRIKPDLVAPGTFIISTKSSLTSGTSDYTYMSGTSMATPIVAGSAALIRQYYTDIEGLSSPSAALLKATLINGAHDMTPGQYGTEDYQEIEWRPDYSQGWGRVDVENSLFAQYPEVIAYYDKETIVNTGDFWEFDYEYIKEGEPLRATLVWTDYPGAVFAGKELVNNLDLTVTDADNTYYGNGAPDTVNNVEGVEIDETAAGDYNIRVDGTSLPDSDITQDFSLVLSFTCDNNEFPENGSSTDDSTTVVSTDVVHPLGVDLSSIQMMINGSPVDFTAVEIGGGYRIYNDTAVPYQNGEYDVSVTAQTVSGQEFSYGWKFNMNAAPITNHAPVLDAIGDQTIDELKELKFTATATDSDLPADTLTFSLTGTVPSGAAITSDGVFTWTPTESQGPDSYTFNVEVSDGSLTDSETITVIIYEDNVAPVLDSIGDQTVDELTELKFTATATDSDLPANTLTFSLAGTVPSGAAITSEGVFTWTPTESQAPDSYTFNVEVSDGSLTDSETIKVTVYEDNVAPVLDAIDDQTVDELKELKFTATATDSDLPADTLTFSLTGTVPSGAAITSEGVFTWTPTESQGPGSYSFDVEVSDGSLTDSENITVTVNEVNVAPVLDAIGDQTVDELKELKFTATATDSDLPADTLTFSLAGTVPSGAAITSDGVFTWKPTESQGPDSYTFNVEVSDGSLTDSETIKVTVYEDNVAPVLDSIGDQTVDELKEIKFTATATDSETLTFSLAGTVPSGAAITSEGVFTWTPTESQGPNSYTFDVEVSDGALTDSETITVTVNEVNVAPVLDAIGDQTVDELKELKFTATATDSDLPADTLTFSLAGTVPSGAAITSEGVLTWTPTESQGPGSYTFDVEVSDGFLTDSETIRINVTDVNAPPEFEYISPKTIEVTKNLQFIINATDMDDDILKYSNVSILPDGATFNESTRFFNWTPKTDQKGTYNVNFTVTDGKEASDNLTVSIIVKELSATTPATSSSSGGGGGGGGGGGTTGEEYENIEIKDVSSIFVGKDKEIKFEFKNPDIDIMYVEYTSLKNAGTISVTIESLKDRSTFVDSSPSGEVYRNINIWVGKTGYAIDANIANPLIAFRVDRNWIDEEGIDESSIALNRYSDGSWNRLPAELVDSDENFLYFEAKTPGFSPFAITGDKIQDEVKLEDTEILHSTQEDSDSENNSELNQTEEKNTLNSSSISGLIICFAFFLVRRK